MTIARIVKNVENYLNGFINKSEIHTHNPSFAISKEHSDRLEFIFEFNQPLFELKVMNHIMNYSKLNDKAYCPFSEIPAKFFDSFITLSEEMMYILVDKAFELIEGGNIDLLVEKVENYNDFIQYCFYQGKLNPIQYCSAVLIYKMDMKHFSPELKRFFEYYLSSAVIEQVYFKQFVNKSKEIIEELIKKSKLMLQ